MRVAVIDTYFFRFDEAPYDSAGTYNTQLLGHNSKINGVSYSYDFVNSSYALDTYGGDPNLQLPHGRRMASLIFSAHNDNRGTAGVVPYATPLLFQINNAAGWTTYSQTAAAVNTAVSWGAKVINLSFGVYYPAYLATGLDWYQPIVDAYNAQRIVVGSCGNNNDGNFYPAGYAEVLGVSAHNKQGDKAWFAGSNTFANTFHADIWAGGVDNLFAGDNYYPNLNAGVSDGGTSGATAFVSGAVARYVQQGKVSNLSTATAKLQRDAWTRPDGKKILDVYYGTVTQ